MKTLLLSALVMVMSLQISYADQNNNPDSEENPIRIIREVR